MRSCSLKCRPSQTSAVCRCIRHMCQPLLQGHSQSRCQMRPQFTAQAQHSARGFLSTSPFGSPRGSSGNRPGPLCPELALYAQAGPALRGSALPMSHLPQTSPAWSGLGCGLLQGTQQCYSPVLGQTGEMWAILTSAGTCHSELHNTTQVALLPVSSP